MFMRFPIDVIFVDGEGRAARIVRNLAPWRIAVALRAHAVIELAAGSLTRDLRVGDELCLVPPVSPTLKVLRRPTLGFWDRTLQGS